MNKLNTTNCENTKCINILDELADLNENFVGNPFYLTQFLLYFIAEKGEYDYNLEEVLEETVLEAFCTLRKTFDDNEKEETINIIKNKINEKKFLDSAYKTNINEFLLKLGF